ncbi:MAG: hypothetical protein KDB86_04875 [Actinobacteria bacterium]|nr:hypothetical protein [Actinomycetota bacterium]MCB9389919.1 hypothetical protein [Acidimicrobiia bacterium]
MRLIAFAGVVALALAGCGSDDGSAALPYCDAAADYVEQLSFQVGGDETAAIDARIESLDALAGPKSDSIRSDIDAVKAGLQDARVQVDKGETVDLATIEPDKNRTIVQQLTVTCSLSVGDSFAGETVASQIDGSVQQEIDGLVPFGEAAQLGDQWTLKVTNVDFDATQAVVAQSGANVEPPPGTQYVLISMDVGYVGQDASGITSLLQAQLVGQGATDYLAAEHRCGILTSDLAAVEVAQGKTAPVQVCFAVGEPEIDALVLEVSDQDTFSNDAVRAFALQ